MAVAEPAVAAAIEQAHRAAVKDALAFIEKHALFTRTGPQGIRQVNVRGLVAAAFTHRDSRAGDPDLHTHVAVANKVQTLDGRWLSIDGRVLFKAKVAASETYNTALEQHLRDTLGVRFAERPERIRQAADPRDRWCRRPVESAVVVTRRAHINLRRGELAVQFQHDHGRPPTPVEARCSWRSRPRWRLATPSTKLDRWLSSAAPGGTKLSGARWPSRRRVDGRDSPCAAVEPSRMVDAHWVAETAGTGAGRHGGDQVDLADVAHLAEAQRQVRTINMPTEQTNTLLGLPH